MRGSPSTDKSRWTDRSWFISSDVTAGGGGQGTSHREISADLPGKERQEKKGKLRRKEGKVENWKWKGEKLQNEERTFSFFCFATFQNHWNLFWVYPNGNFLLGKTFHAWKKEIKKNDFAPSEKYSSYPSSHWPEEVLCCNIKL